MKKKLLSLALAAVMVVMMGTPALATEYKYRDYPYEDVTSDHWARSAVSFCWVHCITNGISETEYGPNETLTRAQFITMMWRALYTDTLVYYEDESQSNSSANWYDECVRDFSDNGYLDGIPTDEISLSQGISRQEMALIMHNVCKSYNSDLDLDMDNASDSITDMASIDSQYAGAVKYCYCIGLLTGYEDGSFNPSKTLTRAEAATVLQKVRAWTMLDSWSVSSAINVGISADLVCQELSNLIIENINDWREENGLKRLQTLWFMNEGSAVRAEECSIVFSHTRPNGHAASNVYEELYGTNMGISEIIVSNQNLLSVTLTEAANTFVEQWKNSSGHNAAMLDTVVDYIGCGVYISSNNVYSAAHMAAIDQLERGGYDSWL